MASHWPIHTAYSQEAQISPQPVHHMWCELSPAVPSPDSTPLSKKQIFLPHCHWLGSTDHSLKQHNEKCMAQAALQNLVFPRKPSLIWMFHLPFFLLAVCLDLAVWTQTHVAAVVLIHTYTTFFYLLFVFSPLSLHSFLIFCVLLEKEQQRYYNTRQIWSWNEQNYCC